MKPYYDEQGIYHGDCREVLAEIEADVVVTDPPYGETQLDFDICVDGWERLLHPSVLWIFGSLRALLNGATELRALGWHLAQDVIWEKHNGSGLHADRFRRVHEIAAQFYRGKWSDVWKRPIYTNDARARTVRKKMRPAPAAIGHPRADRTHARAPPRHKSPSASSSRSSPTAVRLWGPS